LKQKSRDVAKPFRGTRAAGPPYHDLHHATIAPQNIPLWTENRLANWKALSHFVNMEELLLLGAYPSGVKMRNTGMSAEKRLDEPQGKEETAG
jgi:hypothetical protein